MYTALSKYASPELVALIKCIDMKGQDVKSMGTKVQKTQGENVETELCAAGK